MKTKQIAMSIAYTRKNLAEKRSWWGFMLFILLCAQYPLSPAHALPLSAATSYVSVAAGTDGDILQITTQFEPAGQSESVNKPFTIGTSSMQGFGRASASTDISRTTSPSFSYTAGYLYGEGSASMQNGGYTNNSPHAVATSGGIIDYFFKPTLTNTLPSGISVNTLTIPILFSAHGHLEISASNAYSNGTGAISATTNVPGFTAYKNDFRTEILLRGSGSSSITQVGDFIGTANLQLAYNTEYYVSMYGSANTQNWVTSDGSYKFWVDPTFSFDQQAFDLLYGVHSFSLNDYFTLEFSPNMALQQPAVPEPSTILLFTLGLAGLVMIGRKQL